MHEHDFVVCANRELHVRIWNRHETKTVICWHGLVRTSGDFVELGDALAELGYRVIAPDTLGRGLSEWAHSPEEYQIPAYLPHVLALVEHYRIEKTDWVGTSMGGLIGMAAASASLKGRIGRLVINDIGPEIPLDALIRINSYVGELPEFDRLSDFETRIRDIYAPFGTRTEQQWHTMAIQCSRRNEAGKWVSHYDPDVAGRFDPEVSVPTVWPLFEALDARLCLVHGKDSDVLTDDIVARMQSCKPEMTYIPVEGCGHAPGLHKPEHIDPVLQFLTGC